MPYTPTYYSYCCIKCCKSGLFLLRSISLSTIYITYDFYHLKFSKKGSSFVPAGSQKKPHRNVRLFLCPLGIRIIACSWKGCGHGGHAPQASFKVRSGEGSGSVFGVCGDEPLPAGSEQENPQGIVPARNILILSCHAEK